MAKVKQSNKRPRQQAGHDGNSYRIVDEVMDLASTVFRNRKAAGADRLRTFAQSTRAYAASMADFPTLQRQVHLASENIDYFSDYVLNTDIRTMANDATILARRRPLLVLSLAAGAGLAATRLMTAAGTAKAAAHPRPRAHKKATKATVVRRKAMNGSTHAHA